MENPKNLTLNLRNDMKFLNMTLKDSIILAIHNNYEIKIEKLEPMMTEEDITAAKSKFDPTLKITGKIADSEAPSNRGTEVGVLGQEPAGLESRYKMP